MLQKLDRRQIWMLGVTAVVLIGISLLWLFEKRLIQAASDSLAVSFSHQAGYYDEDLSLTLSVPNPEATIYFTLDGSLPDPLNGTVYNQPIAAEAPNVIVVRAQAVLPNGTVGPGASKSYFVGLDATLPVMSIIIDPDDFDSPENGIYTNHFQKGREWERSIDITYVDTDRENGFQIGGGMRTHGGKSRYFANKKSLRLYFRGDYGATKLNYPLFGNEGQIAFDHLVLHNSGQDLLLFKNQLTDQLIQEVDGYMVRSQPVLLFINGRSWGIYNIRERINERLLAENYNIPSADISDTPNNREIQSPEQLAVDIVHWENLMDFALENDLSDPDNYAYLQTQMDVENFVDYYLVQMYIANTDWPHNNVVQFRPRTPGGRWEWIVWDNDFSFDLVSTQMVTHILEVDHPLAARMTIFLEKLLANPDFRNLFITRMADLLNTTLSAGSVQEKISFMASVYGPDIRYEQERWSIDKEWETAVNHMQTFAAQRPDIMRQHMVERLALSGTAHISFDLADGEAGWIEINQLPPQQLPWQGTYFQDSTLQLQAIPAMGYRFLGWDGLSEGETAVSSTITLPVTQDLTLTPRFAPVNPTEPQVGDLQISAVHLDDAPVGDWIELQVQRDGGVDLRGWRLTDNDSKTATDEGSLIFMDDPLFADLAKGTIIRLMITSSVQNKERFPEDDWQNGILLLYVDNGRIDTMTDPWFNLNEQDNLVLLAPGASVNWSDDVAIDFWSSGNTNTTPANFGLPPTVLAPQP